MIYDITQPVFSCAVFPGDPAPRVETLCAIEKGDTINLTAFSMCSHNGTHVDAPSHFIKGGKTVGQLEPSVFVGDCYVSRQEGDVTAEDARRILDKAERAGAPKRILIAGRAVVSEAAARVFAETRISLLGNESQTVGPEEAPMQVHLLLLGAEVALLEGVVLTHVPEGRYFLSAAPLNLGDCEGAPCRAVLISS